MKGLSLSFWIEAGAAVASGLLAILTIFVRDWIEFTGWDPDHQSGAAEWLLVCGLALVSIVSMIAARLEWRRAAQVSS